MHKFTKEKNLSSKERSKESSQSNQKKCTQCKETKPINCFLEDPHSKDGCTSSCKQCASTYFVSLYEKNREKVIAINRKWKEENRDCINEYNQKKANEDPTFVLIRRLRNQVRTRMGIV